LEPYFTFGTSGTHLPKLFVQLAERKQIPLHSESLLQGEEESND
jgi:hypothetical protein